MGRYETVQESKEDNGILPPPEWSFEQTEAWLLQHAASINNGVSPMPTTDLFEQGFDRFVGFVYDKERAINPFAASALRSFVIAYLVH